LALRAPGQLVVAGPWSDDSGALRVFNTDLESLERIVAEDPYYQTLGVHIKFLPEWKPIVSATNLFDAARDSGHGIRPRIRSTRVHWPKSPPNRRIWLSSPR